MATATTPATDKMNGQAIAARSEAVKSLIAKYPEEYAEILKAERLKRGLSAVGGGESTKALEERRAKLLEKLKKAEAELTERGVSV